MSETNQTPKPDLVEMPEPHAPKAKPQAAKKPKVKPKIVRVQSDIGFPYVDLDGAIAVAQAIISAGGVPVSREQLAGVMNQSAGSGSFVTKVAAARLFGLVIYQASRYELTDLGFSIVDTDDKRQRSARAAAFLRVPLYKRVYDEFRGKQLPPRPHGLEHAFRNFGVSQKQTQNARLAFEKSAKQAGFFPHGNDRLIEPIIGPSFTTESSKDRADDEEPVVESMRSFQPSSGPENGLHPFIQGLLKTLPEPETNWTIEGRAKWLQAAGNIFDLIYKGNGEISISVKVPPNSD